MDGYIITYTGRKFYPLDPRPEDVDITDIAHALSHQCRWSGHTKQFFSVAQHSILVSRLCDKSDALWGLLHDSTEAYLIDVPRPLKLKMPDYRRYEAALMGVICDVFGLDREMPASVKNADDLMLQREWYDFIPHDGHDIAVIDCLPIGDLTLVCPGPIEPVAPVDARRVFLAMFDMLTR